MSAPHTFTHPQLRVGDTPSGCFWTEWNFSVNSTAPVLQGKPMGEGWEVMQRKFGRWVRVTTWETPRGPGRLHQAETQEKHYPCLSVRTVMSAGGGDKEAFLESL